MFSPLNQLIRLFIFLAECMGRVAPVLDAFGFRWLGNWIVRTPSSKLETWSLRYAIAAAATLSIAVIGSAVLALIPGPLTSAAQGFTIVGVCLAGTLAQIAVGIVGVGDLKKKRIPAYQFSGYVTVYGEGALLLINVLLSVLLGFAFGPISFLILLWQPVSFGWVYLNTFMMFR